MKWIYGLMLLCCPLAASTLKQQVEAGKVGDFVVTAQEGHYSLLSLRTLSRERIVLEEIVVPIAQVESGSMLGAQWVQERAPGHTAWTLYELDRDSGELIECFSVSKNGWLCLDASEQLFTRLLSLPLTPLPAAERKKIGAQPTDQEMDTRTLWNPPLIREGKKLTGSSTVMRARWPDDHSPLALASVELYFAGSFPFPVWLEVKSPHYTFKLRAVNAGAGLISPFQGEVPHRAPVIEGPAQRGDKVWKLKVRAPPYAQKLHLFALESSRTVPLEILTQSEGSEQLTLSVSTEELARCLQPHHSYKWLLIPEDQADLSAESQEVFIWDVINTHSTTLLSR